MIRIQEDYELYFMAVVGLVYFYGAFGGFGEDIQNRLRMHILFFIVAGAFALIFLWVEKIKSKRKAKQASTMEE